jgi:hypothetical protein
MEPEFGRSLASGINMFLRTQSHKKERTLVGQDIKILDLVTATAPCDPTRWSPASLPSLWRCLPWCRACGAANMLHSLPLKMKKPARNRGLAITGSLQCAPHEGVFEGDGIPILGYIYIVILHDHAMRDRRLKEENHRKIIHKQVILHWHALFAHRWRHHLR